MENKLDPRGDVALLAARACELSYEPLKGNAFNSGITSLGFDDVSTVDIAGVEGFVACSHNTAGGLADVLLVCFRGTDSGADWLADLSADRVDFSDKVPLRLTDMEVHTGFLRTLRVIENEINDAVARNIAGRRLVVCGHSLGAAMAVLYAMRYYGGDVQAVVTFGCPRVGNAAFTNDFNKMHAHHSLRFVRNNDVVTRIPWKFMGYSHVWRQQYIDRWGRLHEDFKASKAWKLYDGFAGRIHRLCRFKLMGGIEDHDIHEYRRLVERAHNTV